MFKKLKNNITKKISKETDDILHTLSKSTIKLILQGDYIKKRNIYKKQINKYFTYFSENYIKVCRYLRDDFGCVTLNDGFNISKEIELMNHALRKLNKGIFKSNKIFKKLNPLMFQNDLDKWKFLNDLFREYPIILNQLKEQTNEIEYHGINFNVERLKLQECEYLKEDFSIIIKKIKEDNIKNNDRNKSIY